MNASYNSKDAWNHIQNIGVNNKHWRISKKEKEEKNIITKS